MTFVGHRSAAASAAATFDFDRRLIRTFLSAHKIFFLRAICLVSLSKRSLSPPLECLHEFLERETLLKEKQVFGFMICFFNEATTCFPFFLYLEFGIHKTSSEE